MTDTLTAAERSERMSRVRGRGNRSTELRLVALFRANEITGWRRNQKLLGRPDFVFRRKRVCVFVDGCFWHGCPHHRRIPKTRVAFWTAKIDGNIRRDRDIARALRQNGWKVLRVWECALTTSQVARTIARIKRAIQHRNNPTSLPDFFWTNTPFSQN